MDLKALMPDDWREVMAGEFNKKYFPQLESFLEEQYASETVFPPQDEIFNAFHHTAYADVKVLLLGQDPYHGVGQAHGLSFSVKPGVKTPPSLRNIYKELKSDLGCPIPNHGNLVSWADQGVLLLNAVLTVRAHTAASHKSKGWEKFTNAVIKQVNAREDPVIFLLWGGYAKKKAKYVDTERHTVVASAHPSPLSARNGFFDSKPFSQINAALEAAGKAPIDWCIESV